METIHKYFCKERKVSSEGNSQIHHIENLPQIINILIMYLLLYIMISTAKD